MAEKFDPYDDFYEGEDEEEVYEEPEFEDHLKNLKRLQSEARKKAAMRNSHNEIGRVIPISEESMERRIAYEKDYVLAHQEIFTNSTGIKPFGEGQIQSVQRTQHVLAHGGRSVIAEPRGFGKTSRTANNALLGALQGKVNYVLILASSVQKAEDVLESIKTELIDNEELYKLYPATCESFRHAADNFNRGPRQTYKGEKTSVELTKSKIRFPIIPGEPSSGSVIQVRSKDNVRGLAIRARFGEKSGKVLRPDFVFMDDIQTDEEAESATSVAKIVATIKKSVLFAGSHSRRISAVMCCTPICPGDVSSHFILNEPSWDCIVTSMVEQMPTHMDMWINEYAQILLDFDRYKTGSRLEAQLKAREFVEQNYEKLHEGSHVSWEWAFGWGEDPQTEISALQHAMNFMIEEGEEAFESECQCHVQQKIDEAEGVKATLDQIVEKTHGFQRFRCPVEAKFVVTHIDVNKDVLTYATAVSPKDWRPMIVDYGTFPEQPGVSWKKRDVVEKISRRYPDVPEEHERAYLAIKELINKLGDRTFYRDDGLEMTHNLILVDMGYLGNEVQRAIRDSKYRNITMCAKGQGIGAKRKQFMERNYQNHAEKHWHCATVPTFDRTLTVLYIDVNYFKTQLHRGFKTRLGLGGSISLFDPDRTGEHLLYGRHCLAETAIDDHYEEEDRHIIIWSNDRDEDNEFFDNTVGCMAGFFKLGCEIRSGRKEKPSDYNIGEYLYGPPQNT